MRLKRGVAFVKRAIAETPKHYKLLLAIKVEEQLYMGIYEPDEKLDKKNYASNTIYTNYRGCRGNAQKLQYIDVKEVSKYTQLHPYVIYKTEYGKIYMSGDVVTFGWHVPPDHLFGKTSYTHVELLRNCINSDADTNFIKEAKSHCLPHYEIRIAVLLPNGRYTAIYEPTDDNPLSKEKGYNPYEFFKESTNGEVKSITMKDYRGSGTEYYIKGGVLYIGRGLTVFGRYSPLWGDNLEEKYGPLKHVNVLDLDEWEEGEELEQEAIVKKEKETRKCSEVIVKKEEVRRCSFCSKQLVRPLRCSRCKKAWYCDVACQRNQWSTHKLLCKRHALFK